MRNTAQVADAIGLGDSNCKQTRPEDVPAEAQRSRAHTGGTPRLRVMGWTCEARRRYAPSGVKPICLWLHGGDMGQGCTCGGTAPLFPQRPPAEGGSDVACAGGSAACS